MKDKKYYHITTTLPIFIFLLVIGMLMRFGTSAPTSTDINWPKIYYWVPLVIAFIFLGSQIHPLGIAFFSQKRVRPSTTTIDFSSLVDCHMGEYSLKCDDDKKHFIVEDRFGTKLMIDLEKQVLKYRKLPLFFVYSKFEDIAFFDLKEDHGSEEHNIYLNHKSNFSISILNTKSGGFSFLDGNREQKVGIEIFYLTILNNLIAPSKES